MTITAAPVSGGVGIVLFRVGALSNGKSDRNGTPTPAASLSFEINAIGMGQTTSFPLGMNMSVTASAPSGVQNRNYTVTVERL